MITIPGVPEWGMWLGFIVLLIIFLELDLGVFNKKDHVIGIRESLMWTAFWISLALIFNAWVWWEFGKDRGIEFFTGYVIEKSLSMDNLFVFLMIFAAFKIPREYQHRVLFWGIVGAMLMRGLFIWLGAELVSAFEWIFLLFGFIVLWGAYRMQFEKEKHINFEDNVAVRFAKKLFPVTDKMDGHKFFIIENGKRHATILFIALVAIEFSDVIFATDSIPAIFAVTKDPFIVFSSNMFAILGLRSLYFAVAGLHAMFVYLKTGLAAILAFIGVKMFIIGMPPFMELFGVDWHWLEAYKIPTMISLIFILAVLAISILASIMATNWGHIREQAPPVERDDGTVHVGVTRKSLKK